VEFSVFLSIIVDGGVFVVTTLNIAI